MEIIDFVQYGTSKELNEEGLGYPVLRLNEFDGFFISKPSKFCSKIDFETFTDLQLLKDDVLICRTNGNFRYVGKSAIVPENYNYGYASYLFKVRPKKELINSSTLVSFLNSKYGRIEIEKYSMASNQVNFSPAKFRQIRIPRFTKSTNHQIQKLVYRSYKQLKNSHQAYKQAELHLLNELGLETFVPSSEGINIKTRSKSFDITGRLDAEYYQPRYDDYLKAVYDYRNGYEQILSACTLKANNFKPVDNISYKYVELSNIGKTGDITGCTIDFGKALPSRARRKIKTGDVIVSSIEGSLESCALITSNYDDALCSTGFYVINSKKINSETLLVLFKSDLMQNLLKQNCSGTILTSINKLDFLKIPIPIIERNVQKKIKSSLEESFNLKKQSEHLLETAKRAVEIAIEENEQTALDYINQNTQLDAS